MEIVRLSGYTVREKEQIARLFLLPRQTEACGLADGMWPSRTTGSMR